MAIQASSLSVAIAIALDFGEVVSEVKIDDMKE